MKVINKEKKTFVEQKNTGSRIRSFVKRSLVMLLAVTVLATSVPFTSFAEATDKAPAESNIGTAAPVENEATGTAPAGAPSEQPEQPAKLTNTSEEPEQAVETASPSEEPEQAVKTATPSEFPKQLRTLVEELPTEATISEITDREEIIYSLDIIALIRKVVALLTESLLPDSTDDAEGIDDKEGIDYTEDIEIVDDVNVSSETDEEDESTSEISAKRATVPEATYYISENNLRPLSEEAKKDYEENIAPVLDERENLLNERLKELEETEKKDEFGDLSALPEALAELIRNIPTNEEITALTERAEIWNVKGQISYIKAYVETYSSDSKIVKKLAAEKGVENSDITEEEIAEVKLTEEQIAYYEETIPSFRDIFISDIVCNGAGRAMYFNGIPEMPVRNINISDCTINSRKGMEICWSEDITLDNVTVVPETGEPLITANVTNLSIL